jgi:hypothetical protein
MSALSTLSRVNTSFVGWSSGGGESVILECPARLAAVGVLTGESLVGEIDLARSVGPFVNDRTRNAAYYFSSRERSWSAHTSSSGLPLFSAL